MIQVKRYTAPTYAEALIKAKNELGADALIVDTKRVRVGGIFGLFQKTLTELTVAVDVPEPKAPAVGPASPQIAPPQPAAAAPAPPASSLSPAPLPPSSTAALEREIASLRSAVNRLVTKQEDQAALERLSPFGRETFDILVARGVESDVALEISLKLTEKGDDKLWLHAEVTRLLAPFQPTRLIPGQRKIAALVGPTGAGKTTTLAKLAAHFALLQGQKVGLITADSFRIAAIEQLRVYGDILGIPLHAVDSPHEMALALQQTADCDVVLVDTGGRNHKDPERMAELKETLAVLRPDETHLVISLTANPRDAYELLEYYGPLGVNRLLFTKLDEATCPGLMINMRRRCTYPVGYITCGQEVPDDIMPADQVDFAHILLGA